MALIVQNFVNNQFAPVSLVDIALAKRPKRNGSNIIEHVGLSPQFELG